ncbi:protein FAM228B-like [Rhopilema esculentum]|uniref:protein FAM228B-like n=1 Tax=Rhopilema esculentum TaxID=499914 RepID=UPI0031D83690
MLLPGLLYQKSIAKTKIIEVPRTAASSGIVSIHSLRPLEEILLDKTAGHPSREGEATTRRKSERSKSAGCIPSHQDGKTLRHNSELLKLDIKSWLSEKSAKSIQEKTEYESSTVRNLYNTLLDNETELVESVDDYLAETEELQRRKRYLLMKDWTENVYNPLKASIDKEMESKNYRRLDKGKRKIYKDYLAYSNRKGNVFLDTMSYEEYDPLAISGHRPGPLKVVMKKPSDPLQFQAAKRDDEERVVISCQTGLELTDREIEQFRLPPLPLVPLGRHGTGCGKLLEMELHDIQSDVRQRSQRRMLGIRTNSDIDFEAWQDAALEPNVIDKELRSRKKKQFQEKHESTILLT